jgi:hypothetical protein
MEAFTEYPSLCAAIWQYFVVLFQKTSMLMNTISNNHILQKCAKFFSEKSKNSIGKRETRDCVLVS